MRFGPEEGTGPQPQKVTEKLIIRFPILVQYFQKLLLIKQFEGPDDCLVMHKYIDECPLKYRSS